MDAGSHPFTHAFLGESNFLDTQDLPTFVSTRSRSS